MANAFQDSDAGTHPQSVEDLLRLAREDLNKSSLTSAERALEQAILMNNQVAEAFHLLGLVYTKKGKFKKAILAFEKTLALDPFHTDAAIALSSLYNDTGRYKDAAGIFLKTKRRLDKTLPGYDPKINQNLAEKHLELGKEYLKYERFAEAHHEFSKASKLDPEVVHYAILMARCLAKMNDKDGALVLLQKAIEKEPKNVEARIQLGVLLHSQQKLREAYREWQEALALDPDSKSAQMYLSMFEYEPTLGGSAHSEKNPLSRSLT